MERRRIGSLDVSVVGLGCNNFGMRISAEAARDVVDAAIDAGINYFDTAESYGGGASEEFLGQALEGRRDQVFIATKWGMTGGDGPRPGAPESVRCALEGSLKRLGMDYVDHYQLHRPDRKTPVAETLGALDELRSEGKIREIGCSNFSAEQLDEAAAVAGERSFAPFVSVQNHYSLLTRDPETNGVLEACARHSIAFVPFFPLESGVLTGKYKEGQPLPEGSRLEAWGERAASFLGENQNRLAVVGRLSEWAESRGHTLLELAMSWRVTTRGVARVIAGPTRPEQVRSNVSAAGWALTEDERAEVDRLLAG